MDHALMEPTGFGLISLVTFLPLIGALLLLMVPDSFPKAIKVVALGITVVTFAASLFLFVQFDPATFHFQLVESKPWIEQLGISYHVGVDGISIWLVMLTTFLSIIATWFSFYVNERVKAYFVFMLLLETAMVGVFVSPDMILFYTFFEASLIPMFFLINIWGGTNRRYAAIKFFIYTFTGSIFMLIGMIWMHQLMRQATGIATFDIVQLQTAVANGTLWANAIQAQAMIFWMFTIAFMVKCPMFPFHTWLPDAHVEAPTAGSVILAGVLLKMGTYGFLRFSLPLFPDVIKQQVPIIIGLSVVGIIYGALVAAVQPDLKKLVAYSSVSHMGFVVLGIFSLTLNGLAGGAMQQLNHGISTGALFLLIGLLYERRHTRMFKDFGGLKAQMPIYAALFLIVMLSSVGLPGTNGFVGEFLALLGGFEAARAGAYGLNVAWIVVAASGVILAAVYLLVMFMKVFYGPNTNPANLRLRDLKSWEIGMVGLLVVFIFWGGLMPNTFLQPMTASLQATRMMAINPVGQRPSWSSPHLEIDRRGNLVHLNRVDGQVLRVVAPADLHFTTPNPKGSQQAEPALQVRRTD